MSDTSSSLIVVKIGGSVLTGEAAFVATAASLARRTADERASLLVVVSAELGHTDTLLEEARTIAPRPDSATLDLLWSTGELRSVALLTLALKAQGVAATGLNIHETGLRRTDGALAINPIAVRVALSRHEIVVVPGFLAAQDQRVVTLGRGGSDLSAVTLAVLLHADRCELIKDVDGYFTADPNVDARATLIPALDFDRALRLADDGCPLVQRQAIAAARDAGVPLVVRSLSSEGSVIGASRLSNFRPSDSQGDLNGFRDSNHSRRSAL